jgi:GNAT superfamily N-acetyltransferase
MAAVGFLLVASFQAWTVHGVGGPLTAIARGAIEPLEDGERSRVTIALEFEGHGIGTGLLLLIRRQARRQLHEERAEAEGVARARACELRLGSRRGEEET